MIHRTIGEWERIDYGNSETTIPEILGDRLAEAARRSSLSGESGEGVLQHGRNWLKSRGIVGIISVPGGQLEILPKVDEKDSDTGENRSIARGRLIHMLSKVYDLDIDKDFTASLGFQCSTLLEALIRLFCIRVFDAVHKGMPRQYREYGDDLPILRGRLNVARQFTNNILFPQKLASQFDVLSYDIPLNQIIRAVVVKLMHISKSQENQRMLQQLESMYSSVSDTSVHSLRCKSIVYDRASKRWKELVVYAQFLLSGIFQTTSSGKNIGYALLFDMGSLFEKYVGRLMEKALVETDLDVHTQWGNCSCIFHENSGFHNTRLDIVIKRKGDIVLIIDTKWKKLDRVGKDVVANVSQHDVYQMMTYQRIYNCSRVMLLYPHHRTLGTKAIQYRYSIAKPNSLSVMILSTFNIEDSIADQKFFIRRLVEAEIESLDRC